MGMLYLVRHGQASFGAADYDQLSDLGQRQSERLGRYWAERGLHFSAVITGSLRRHTQTWEGIASGAGLSPGACTAEGVENWTASDGLQPTTLLPRRLPVPLVWPGLNEYDSLAVIRTVHAAPLPKPDTPEHYRLYFRLLRDGLAQWMAGTVSPEGMPSYVDFVRGITDALDHVRREHLGQPVLLVSSGGPISTAVGQVLGLSPERTIELNMRIRNSAVTEFEFSAKRHRLMTFNTLAHLDAPEHRDWITYA